jgi:high-affinity iron transporter
LAAAAFLAVFREGAETILFYQALVSGNPTSTGEIVLGFAAGTLVLVGIFLTLRYGSVRIPIKPFFIATSALLYYLAFVFAGQGVRELQEAGVVASTIIKGVPVIEILGIYPTLETLSLQSALVLAAIGGLIWQFLRSRKQIALAAVAEPARETKNR